MNRPPPYFPQNALNPPNDKRYRRFKMMIVSIILLIALGLVGIGFGIYYLISRFSA